MMKSMVHVPHTSDRPRPAGTASETNASLRRYASCRFIVASGLAESRCGLVTASLAVVAAGKRCRCGADSAEAFARGLELSSASEEWEVRRTNHSMLQGGTRLDILLLTIDVEKSCNQSAGTQDSSLQCGKVDVAFARGIKRGCNSEQALPVGGKPDGRPGSMCGGRVA